MIKKNFVIIHKLFKTRQTTPPSLLSLFLFFLLLDEDGDGEMETETIKCNNCSNVAVIKHGIAGGGWGYFCATCELKKILKTETELNT